MLNVYGVGVVSILSCLLAAVLSEILDNFTIKHINNRWGMRYGIGKVRVDVTYPRQGISIPGKRDFLIQELSFDPDEYYDCSGKSLKIEYTAFQDGSLPIFLKYKYNNRLYTDQSGIAVPVQEGRHKQISVPFSHFTSDDDRLHSCLAVAIQGPLFVHQLELINTSDDTEVAIPYSSVEKCDSLEILRYPPNIQLLNNKTTQHQFKEYDSNTSFRNHNSLGLRRGGYGITKVPNGVSISNGGCLFENLPTGINLERKSLQLTLTWQYISYIQINVQHHHDPGLTGQNAASSYTLKVSRGKEKTVVVPFSRFPKIQYKDVKRIWIFGPIAIHSIQFVKNNLISCVSDTSPVLVDNFDFWPSNLVVTNMVIDIPSTSSADAKLFNLNNNTPGSGLNLLNYWCIGDGISIANHGIQLSNDGFVYEQLAFCNNFYNLTKKDARLVIQYSAKHQIKRTLKIFTVIPNDTDNHYHIEPVQFDLHFVPGKHRIVKIDVGICGPSNAILIAGQGAVTLHKIQLNYQQLGIKTTIFTIIDIDDFSDWPLMSKSNPIMAVDPMNSSFLINNMGSAMALNGETNLVSSGSHPPTFFDYWHTNWHQMPLFQKCKYLGGHGVEIESDGRLFQPFDDNVPKNMVITYSATYSATRRMGCINISHGSRVTPKYYHAFFNSGQFQRAVIPIDSCHGIVFDGPIVLHQVQLVENAKPIDLLPGQSTTKALLIDDFSGWKNDPLHPNNLNDELYSSYPNGFGAVTLHSSDQYLIEGFPVIWDSYLSPMVLQITYSIEDQGICLVSLIPKSADLMKLQDPYNAILPQYSITRFYPGTRSTKQIHTSNLLNGILNDYREFNAFVIHGPILHNSLTIHRIEIMPRVAYCIPIIPKHDVVPFHWTGSRTLELDQANNQFNIACAILDLLKEDQEVQLLHVERGHMWRDSYQILGLTPAQLQMKLNVKFIGESGIDENGLTREFFTLMAQVINNPDYALFTPMKDANHALHINPNSKIHADHLDRFRIVGRIIGKAILSKHLLGIRLVPCLYRKMIEKPSTHKNELPNLIDNDKQVPDISELDTIDPVIGKSLAWILREDITKNSKNEGWTMTVECDFFGEKTFVDLVKDGSQHKVTQQNKNQYVREKAKWHIIQFVEAQANALRDGVWDVVPQPNLSLFTESQLEVIIAGTSSINLQDWKDHSKYQILNLSHELSREHPIILQFWKCVQGWDSTQHAQLLRFTTGSSLLPSTGFKGLRPKFKILSLDETIFYPIASTCANMLKLPLYADPHVLCKRLEDVIQVEQFDHA